MTTSKNSGVSDLNPHVEARRVHLAAQKAERERLYGRAQVQPIRGPVPEPKKGFERYVVSEDCVTPDGKHHRPGEVVLVSKEHEPSQTWCPFDEHASQQDQES